jgi:hypothetical protein
MMIDEALRVVDEVLAADRRPDRRERIEHLRATYESYDYGAVMDQYESLGMSDEQARAFWLQRVTPSLLSALGEERPS